MSYTIGGGGGVASSSTTSDEYALSQPYEINGGQFTSEIALQINQNFDLLFKALARTKTDINTNTTAIAAIDTTSDLLVAEATLTNAQLQSLNTSPAVIVAAPGAGMWINPVSFAIEKVIGSAMSAATTWNFRFDGIAVALQGTAIAPLLATVESRWIGGTFSDNGAWVMTNDPTNLALTLFGSADVTGGTSANSVVVKVAYYLVDTI